MAGRILRWVRSPVAPKITIWHGSGTFSMASPARSGLSNVCSAGRYTWTVSRGVAVFVVPAAVLGALGVFVVLAVLGVLGAVGRVVVATGAATPFSQRGRRTGCAARR